MREQLLRKEYDLLNKVHILSNLGLFKAEMEIKLSENESLSESIKSALKRKIDILEETEIWIVRLFEDYEKCFRDNYKYFKDSIDNKAENILLKRENEELKKNI